MLSGWCHESSGAGGAGYAVVDLEATGPSPRRHRVLEVAVVLLDDRCRPEAEFATLVDPRGPVGPTHIHGIGTGDVGGAPRFAEIAAHLLGLLRGRVLVGHHVACDLGFLVGEYARVGVALPAVPTLCTMRLAADHLPALDGLSLRACCAAAGLPRFAEHTALGDARATAALLRHCAELLSGCSGRGRPVAWSHALLEAAALQWPSLVSQGAPRTVRRAATWGFGGNARPGGMVPARPKGGA
ncbi:hypothetical protein GCM10027168_03730 [Streptomyces capparidis]